ncbi:MAG: pyridoxal-phosphate dependent enzyme [Acidobacteriota bacterium]|nr:pyridoxal-phosphate dependent enzyme [Acidobacteriota bacterium]
MRLLLSRLYGEGVRLTGCWDTRVSKLGQGLAACCAEFPGMRCVVSYPVKKGEPQPEAIRAAAGLGAEVYPVPGSRITICFAAARRYVQGRGGFMLPFGLECAEAVEGVRREAASIPVELVRGGTLVVCCGSGVTLAGLLSGLPVLPRRIVGVSSGRSPAKIRACLGRYVASLPGGLELRPAAVPYAVAVTHPCPFPAHPHYDLKAWKFLLDNLREFTRPILFWNIGA